MHVCAARTENDMGTICPHTAHLCPHITKHTRHEAGSTDNKVTTPTTQIRHGEVKRRWPHTFALVLAANNEDFPARGGNHSLQVLLVQEHVLKSQRLKRRLERRHNGAVTFCKHGRSRLASVLRAKPSQQTREKTLKKNFHK